jgi:signal transduction histidine kinase/ActR/RegA family two-component response regulator
VYLDAITLWAIGMVLTAIGLVLLVAPAPAFVTVDLATGFLLVATGNTWTAARRFAGKPLKPLWALLGALIWLLARRFHSFEQPGVYMTLSWSIGAAYSFATAVAIWPDGTESLPARQAMLVLLILHGLLYGGRAAMAASGLDESFRAALSQAVMIETQFRVIGMAFLVIAMTKQRAENAIACSLKAAHQAVDARQRFLTHMSHEVRTPLNGVLGLAQLLARDNRLLADQRQHVKALEDAGRHLLAIVNDALDLAKIDAGRMDFVGRSFDLEEAADGCLALVRPAATDKHVTLALDADPSLPPLVVGDRTRLQQILLNLLWNAIKFTPVAGSVTLRIIPAELGLCFEIVDTGPGIPPDRRHRLFQDFSQLEPMPTEGTGLGLAISARLARQMHGDLSYHPSPAGAGSMFRLELPWPAASGMSEAMPQVDLEPSAGGLDLLVVDDVRVNRRLLQAMLTAADHRVVEVSNGPDALNLLARQPFHAVLLDLHMPGMDGYEVARRIRTRGSDVAVIGVSADAMPETIRACLTAGMDAVVPKPVDRSALLTTLDRTRIRRRPGGAVAGATRL